MLAHCNLKQNMCLCSKQSSLISFYALPSNGKSKDAVVHFRETEISVYLGAHDFVLAEDSTVKCGCNQYLGPET